MHREAYGLTSRLATENQKCCVRRMGSRVGKQQKNQAPKGYLRTAETEYPFEKATLEMVLLLLLCINL